MGDHRWKRATSSLERVSSDYVCRVVPRNTIPISCCLNAEPRMADYSCPSTPTIVIVVFPSSVLRVPASVPPEA